ncbi:MAG TPA: hypothetical protein VMV09_02640 [Candidatus Saccharimonadales bacterium]|nr:hypothetical protein [Candidatus Saccharimonadales bacterium]
MAEFTCRFKASSVAGLEAALDQLVAAAVQSTPVAVAQAATIVQGRARDNASHRPGPNVISGDLKRSIITGAGATAGPMVPGVARLGPFLWSSVVGPTVIYGRIQELGGHVYPHHMARSGSGRPGMLSWVAGGKRIYAMHAYIPPRPYLSPALASSQGAIQQKFYDIWAGAMVGLPTPSMPPTQSFTPPTPKPTNLQWWAPRTAESRAAYRRKAQAESRAGYRHGDYDWSWGVKWRKPGEKK